MSSRFPADAFPLYPVQTVIWGSRKMAGSLSGSMSLRRWPVCTLDLAGLCRLDENFEIELTCPLKNTASGMVHIRVVTYRLEDMPNPPDYPSPSLQDNASIQMLGEALSVFVPVKDAAAPGLRGTNKSNLYDVLGRMAKKTHVKEMTMSFYEVVHPAKAPKPEPPGQLAAPAGGMERPEIDGLSNEVRTYPTLAPAADSSKPVKKRSGLIQGFQHGLSLSSARLMAKHHQQNEQQWNPSSLGDLSVQEDAWSVAGGTDQSSDSDSECRDTPMLSLVVSRAACEVSRSDTLAIETSVGPSSSKASSDENWHALDRILESRDDSDQAGAVEEHSSVAVQVSQSLAMADRVAADVVSTEETERQGRHMAKKTSSSSRVTRHDTWTTGLNGFAAARPPTLQGNGCVQGPGKVLAAPPARVPNAEPASVAVRPGSGSGSGSARPAVATSTSVRAEAGREQQADRSRHDNLTKGNHAAAPAKRVVCVAVDGSDRSPKMLSWVISGVAKEDDELHVVSVAEPDWSPCVFPVRSWLCCHCPFLPCNRCVHQSCPRASCAAFPPACVHRRTRVKLRS